MNRLNFLTNPCPTIKKAAFRSLYSELALHKAALKIYTKPLFFWRKALQRSHSGLRALEGVYGRKVQPKEFSDTYLPRGVAFAKLPGREPERIKYWD